ncbi:MAG TPA: hypothetical protein VNM43_05935 [Dehalococcoidia bacterium]|nr:hypothetical protein [Dehalococcoidia bacterium]
MATTALTGPGYRVEIEVLDAGAPDGVTVRVRYQGDVEVASYEGGFTLRAGEGAGLLPDPVPEGAECPGYGEERMDALLIDEVDEDVECTTCGRRYELPAPEPARYRP